MQQKNEVYFTELPGKNGALGLITLNRPQVLNSLNDTMIHAMLYQLRQWATDDHIKGVLIRAVQGRAFCAGGDLRLTYTLAKTKDAALLNLFREEFQLNHCIFHYPKPYIALLDGITMGGGAGISIHGSHRVATERLVFAMPETTIGFFTDVGANYFLPRIKDKWGIYLGLSSARIHSDDAVALGIAQHKVASDDIDALIEALVHTSFGNNPKQMVTQIIEQFQLPASDVLLAMYTHRIKHIFSAPTIEAILVALENHEDPFYANTRLELLKKSPTSLKVTLRALQAGAMHDFDECIEKTYHLTYHFLQGHDFLEGIRALIVDKDNEPRWQPATLNAVTIDLIDHYFSKAPLPPLF